MIADAATVPDGMVLRTDIAVVGAGPAGIVLALSLAAQGRTVLLLESGGAAPDRAGTALNRGTVADPARHAPPHRFRRRALGGASGVWGGRTSALDAIDFAPRPWIAPLGWPIGPAALAPWMGEAHRWCEAGDDDAMPAMPPILPGFDGRFTTDASFERFSCPTDFGRRYWRRLATAPGLTVLLRATVTAIETADSRRGVTALAVRTPAGGCRIVPRTVVLAMGGLEIPRLLQASGGLGNDHDQVGRCYMGHLAGAAGRFRPAPGVPVWHGYGQGEDGAFCRRRFVLRPAAQRALGTGNILFRLHHPRIGDPAHRSGALSLLAAMRPFVPWEYRTRLEGGGPRLGHLRNLVLDMPAALRFGRTMLAGRAWRARQYPSVVVHAPSGDYSLDIHAEQAPNPASRVMLGTARDAHGVPRLHVDWRTSAVDRETVRRGVAALARDLAASGVGRLEGAPGAIADAVLGAGAYGGHHIGTARMAASARDGVVDGDCRVHGVGNLFVAGSAVMPTSGAANPTLTLVALALRLADHLAGAAGAQPAAEAEAPGRRRPALV